MIYFLRGWVGLEGVGGAEGEKSGPFLVSRGLEPLVAVGESGNACSLGEDCSCCSPVIG